MYLHKISVNLRCKEARRDLSDFYEMHSTLCRAFAEPDTKCPPGSLLWRLEPEEDNERMPIVLVQSRNLPEWSRINPNEWFCGKPSDPVNILQKVAPYVETGKRFRYRLRANPSVKKAGKRFGLYDSDDQISWINRQGERNGFKPITVHLSAGRTFVGQKRNNNPIRIFSVLYDGMLEVVNAADFKKAIVDGIGHGKAMGMGLLSIMPAA
jgi:CRISPR system Cascade subunit CasE